MEQKIWNNPQATSHTTLAIAEGGIFLGSPSPGELDQARDAVEHGRSPAGQMGDGALFVAPENLFRILAKPGSSALGLAYRHDGVKMDSFSFARPEERDEAVGRLEQEMGLRRSTQKSSGGWAEALKPALYLVAVVMITIGLAGALGDPSATIDGTGRTAAKAQGLVALAGFLGPTGVWVAGGILSAIFLLQVIVKLRLPGESTVLEPARA